MSAKALLLLLIFVLAKNLSFGQLAFSVKDGNWDDPAVWSGNQVPNASFDVITIRHTVHVRSSAYPSSSPLVIDQAIVGADAFAGYLIIDSGSYLQVNHETGNDLTFSGSPTSGKIDVRGRLTASPGVVFSGNTESNFNYLAGSTYEHQSASAAIPLPTATYTANCTLLINGFTGSGTFSPAWNVPVGNVIYNCPHQGSGSVNFAGFLSHVRGSFDIQNTGTSGIIYFNQTGTSTLSASSAITIEGHLFVTGVSRVFLATTGIVEVYVAGDFTFNPDASSGSSQCVTSGAGTLFINGNTTMRRGSWNFSSGTNGNGTFNLNGSLYSSGAILTETGGGTSQGNLNFNGVSGTQTFDPTGVAATSINVTINNSSGVMVSDDLLLAGTLTLTQGSLILPDISLTLNGPIVQSNGSITTSASPALTIGGSGQLPAGLSIVNGSTFDSFQLNRASTTLVSNSNFTVGTLQLYAGNFTNNGAITIADGGLVDRKATSASATGMLSHAPEAAGGYHVRYTNTVELTTGPELPTNSSALLSFTKSGSDILTLNSDIIIHGDLTVSAGILSDGGTSRSITLLGNFRNDGNSNFSASTFTFGNSYSGTSLSGSTNPTFGNLNFLNNVVISSGFRVDANLTVGPGLVIPARTGTASFGGTTVINNAGTLNLSAVTILANGTVTANNSSFTVAGTFTVSGSGTFVATPGADITFNGNLSVTGTFTSYAKVIFADTTKMTGTGTKTFNDVTITGVLTPNSAYTVTGNLTLNGAGILNAGNSTTTFGGNTILSNTGTGHIIFNNMTIIAGKSITANSDFTITGATLTWNSGNFYSSAETTLGRAGTITLRGTGSIVFSTLTIASETTFTPNAPYAIKGDLNINGVLRAGNNTTVFGGTTSISTTGTPTISFNNLEIGAGDSLTSYPGTITINGNFASEGFFNANGGTVTFAGNTTKNISGTSVTSFNNINVSNGSAATDVSIESNQNLSGVLTLAANAHFDADGFANTSVFTLLSSGDNPTGDACVATLPSGSQVLGNVTVQRYISIEGPNNSRIYRYLSSSVVNARASDLQNEIPITGGFTGTSICSGCGTSPSAFWYDESVTTGGINGGYTPFPAVDNTEVLVPGRGYATFVRGNINPILGAGSARYDLRGPINSGLVNYNVTFTSSGVAANDGWNLIGNPYPSTIDWNATGWTKTNVNGTIYTLDNGVNPSRYATWNGSVGTNGGSRYIAAGQGFFIQTAKSLPSLTSTESTKVAGIQTTYFRLSGPTNALRITLVQGDQRDESIIHFRDSATTAFDVNYDAIKLKNLKNDDSNTPFLNLSTLSPQSSQKLAINSLPVFNCATTVSLDISDVPKGSYELNFSNLESFPEDVGIFLSDNLAVLGMPIDVRQQPKYIFQVTDQSNSYGSGRFEVIFSISPPPSPVTLLALPICPGNDACVTVENTQLGISYFLERKGIQIGQTLYGTGGPLSLTIPKDSLMSGSNLFEVWAQSSACSNSVSAQKDSIQVLDIYPVRQVTSSTECRTGSVTLTAAAIPADGHYNWYDAQNDLEPISGQSTSIFITPVLVKSKTYYVAAVSSQGCEGQRVPVVAAIVNFDDAAIVQVDGETLQSNFSTGNHWYLEEALLPDTTATIKINSSGKYKLEVKIGDCSTSVEHYFVITGLEKNPWFKAYPNPVTDLFLVDIPDEQDQISDPIIVNSVGQQIGVVRLIHLGATNHGQFDFSSYAAGLYYIKIISDNIIVVKIVKK